jgi:uncharacterized protein (TIGR03067 family)
MFARAAVGVVLAVLAIGVVTADSTRVKDKFQAVEGLDLEGEWGTSAAFVDGERLSWDGIAIVFVFKGGRFDKRVCWTKDTGGGSYVVKRGKEIDLAYHWGKLGGKTYKGIYEYDVHGDTLTLWYVQPGQDRPTEFEYKEDSDGWLITLKRLNP